MEDRECRWYAWMTAARSGDKASYNHFLTDVADRVRRHARRRLARSGFPLDEVEDIVQEALVAVHTKRETWDPGRPIAPWVDAIIRYKTLDALRRIGREAAKATNFDRAAENLPAAGHEQSSDLADLDRHIGALPTREQGVVAALGLDGISAAKCAERFGISETAVRVAFHRGLARLARLADTAPTQDRDAQDLRRKGLRPQRLSPQRLSPQGLNQ
ncbi:MAG: sigma-70 family RNA polymerase sigma factor [Pseudomonadota bacterium]